MEEENISSNEYLLTRNQVRAGRVLAGLGIRDLAAVAGMSPTALSQIETGRTEQAHEVTLRALRTALEDQGVEFAPEGWVRHRADTDGPRTRIQEHSLARNIGKACKEARNNLGMTHDEVADAIDETVEFYSRVELGSVLPTLSTLIRMADALETSIDEMLGRTLLCEIHTLEDIANMNPAQARQLARLLGVAQPTAVRVVTVVLKEVIRIQHRKLEPA